MSFCHPATTGPYSSTTWSGTCVEPPTGPAKQIPALLAADHAPSPVGRFRVPDRHHIVGAHEYMQLTELHLLLSVEVTCRPEHKQRRSVALQLWTLVGRDSVVHRKRMQVELRSD